MTSFIVSCSLYDDDEDDDGNDNDGHHHQNHNCSGVTPTDADNSEWFKRFIKKVD